MIYSDIHNSVSPSSPGSHPEVFLNEVAGDRQWQKSNEEDGCHVGDDTQGGHTQQGGAGEALQRGGDVLVDCVCVCGKPVEDAAEWSGLKQPGGAKKQKEPHLIITGEQIMIACWKCGTVVTYLFSTKCF